MKKIFMALGMILLLSACNTFEGIGKDVQSAGQWTTDSAQSVQDKINGK